MTCSTSLVFHRSLWCLTSLRQVRCALPGAGCGSPPARHRHCLRGGSSHPLFLHAAGRSVVYVRTPVRLLEAKTPNGQNSTRAGHGQVARATAAPPPPAAPPTEDPRTERAVAQPGVLPGGCRVRSAPRAGLARPERSGVSFPLAMHSPPATPTECCVPRFCSARARTALTHARCHQRGKRRGQNTHRGESRLESRGRTESDGAAVPDLRPAAAGGGPDARTGR